MTMVQHAAGFIGRTLQNEGVWYRADDVEGRLGGSLASCGALVGAVRGTVRDALRKVRDLDHDAVVFLRSAQTSELTDLLLSDVLVPLIGTLDGQGRKRAFVVLERWRNDPDHQLRAAARTGENHE